MREPQMHNRPPTEEELIKRGHNLINKKLKDARGLIGMMSGYKDSEVESIEVYIDKVETKIKEKDYGSGELEAYNTNLILRLNRLMKIASKKTGLSEDALENKLNPENIDVS